MHSFVVVEGPDGAGKTTTIDAILDRTNYSFFKPPEESYMKIRSEFNRHDTNPLTRFGFYAAGLVASIPKIMELKETEGGVLVDRYTLSTIFYHEELAPGIDIKAIVDGMLLPEPDAQIILTANPEVLLSRNEQRNQRYDQYLENDTQLITNLNERFRQVRDSRCLHVDTGIYPVEEVVERCLRHLQI